MQACQLRVARVVVIFYTIISNSYLRAASDVGGIDPRTLDPRRQNTLKGPVPFKGCRR